MTSGPNAFLTLSSVSARWTSYVVASSSAGTSSTVIPVTSSAERGVMGNVRSAK